MRKFGLCVMIATLCGVTTWIAWKFKSMKKPSDPSERQPLSTETPNSYDEKKRSTVKSPPSQTNNSDSASVQSEKVTSKPQPQPQPQTSILLETKTKSELNSPLLQTESTRPTKRIPPLRVPVEEEEESEEESKDQQKRNINDSQLQSSHSQSLQSQSLQSQSLQSQSQSQSQSPQSQSLLTDLENNQSSHHSQSESSKQQQQLIQQSTQSQTEIPTQTKNTTITINTNITTTTAATSSSSSSTTTTTNTRPPSPSRSPSQPVLVGAPPSRLNKKPRSLPTFKTNLEQIRDEFGGVPDDEAERLRKVEHEDKQYSLVRDRIYLGSHYTTQDRNRLKEHEITHILNTASTVCPNYFIEDKTLSYLSFPLSDSLSEDILCFLYDAIEFMDSAIEKKGNVLVHCWQGVSRSTAFVISWLILHEGVTFDEGLQIVRKSRTIARPNHGFMYQLLEWETRLKQGVSTEPMLYHCIPYLESNPPRYIAKRIKPINRNILTEENCIILHTSQTLYLWIGNKSDENCVNFSQIHIKRLQKYELAPKLVIFKQGEENELFLKSFE